MIATQTRTTLKSKGEVRVAGRLSDQGEASATPNSATRHRIAIHPRCEIGTLVPSTTTITTEPSCGAHHPHLPKDLSRQEMKPGRNVAASR